jgi:hypothetical protein
MLPLKVKLLDEAMLTRSFKFDYSNNDSVLYLKFKRVKPDEILLYVHTVNAKGE